MDGRGCDRRYMRRVLTHPFVLGVAGVVVTLLVWSIAKHVYDDHLALHYMADYLNRHAQQINKLP